MHSSYTVLGLQLMITYLIILSINGIAAFTKRAHRVCNMSPRGGKTEMEAVCEEAIKDEEGLRKIQR